MLRTRVEGAREYSRRLPTAAASLAFETAVAVRECVCTEMKEIGYTTADLKAAGYTPRDCRNAGFTDDQIQAAGWSGRGWDYKLW